MSEKPKKKSLKDRIRGRLGRKETLLESVNADILAFEDRILTMLEKTEETSKINPAWVFLGK